MIHRLARNVAILSIAARAAWPSLGAAQEASGVGQLTSSGPVTTAASRKITSAIRALMADVQATAGRQGASPVDRKGSRPSETLRMDAAGRVQVYVSVADTTEATLDVLRRHRLEIEVVNASFRIVQGWISVSELEALAREASVIKIRPPSYGYARTGSADTQGDGIHRCDAARAAGFTGLGVKVGVVSGGVDGLAASQASGDLPAAVEIVQAQAASDDEGTAMLEVVHDCAPAASLA